MEAVPFEGCARCGLKACSGACGELALFQSVSCLFGYARPLSTLLLQAKNDQSQEGQRAFRDLFFVRLQRSLGQLVVRHRVERVVLAPLRWSRLLALHWHPHELFVEVLEGLRAQGFEFEMEVPVKVWWGRQAARAASERRAEVRQLNLAQGALGSPCETGVLPLPSGLPHPSRFFRLPRVPRVPESVLIVDDVLTSGQTALRLALQRKALCAPGVPPGPFHLFSLLRTPVEAPTP